MTDTTSDHDGGWIVLFSGGKESAWALHRSQASGLDVRRLVYVHAADTSAYHTPATPVVRLAARSIGLPLVDAGLPTIDAEPPDVVADPAGADAALRPLEETVRELADALADGLAGIVVGTVTDQHRADRVRSICDRVGCAFRAPLWGAEPRELAEAMLDGGLEIIVAEVTAPGFDERWLGRRLDHEALADLERLGREYGVSLLGEGDEFETVVTDGPHMSRPIGLEFEREWHGSWGRVRITDAWLEDPADE